MKKQFANHLHMTKTLRTFLYLLCFTTLPACTDTGYLLVLAIAYPEETGVVVTEFVKNETKSTYQSIINSTNDYLTEEQLDAICLENGIPTDGGILNEKGYYSPNVPFEKIVGKLVSKKFHFLEFDATYENKLNIRRLNKKLILNNANGGSYLRLSIRKKGAPGCIEWEAWQNQINYTSAAKRFWVTKEGFLPDYCVAIERTKTLKSKYLIQDFWGRKDKKQPEISWNGTEIRLIEKEKYDPLTNDTSTSPHTTRQEFSYCLKGEFSSSISKCLGEVVYRCYPEKNKREFRSKVNTEVITDFDIRNKRIVSKKPLPFKSLSIRTPGPQQPQTVYKGKLQLTNTIHKRENFSKFNNVRYFYSQYAKNTFARITDIRNSSLYIETIGDKSQSFISQPLFINGRHIKIKDYKASNLINTSGNNLHLLLFPRSHEEKEFYILRFNLEGDFLSQIICQLPFSFTQKEGYYPYFANLNFANNIYTFSILISENSYTQTSRYSYVEYQYKVHNNSIVAK
jgi:hypothetical protein